MNNAAKYRELRSEIEAILLHDWDPIGIVAEAGAQDEYNAYAPAVFSLLCRTQNPADVARYLIGIEVDRMGSDEVDLSARLPVANRLVGIAARNGLRPGPYPCPACGFLVFAEPPGSYDICPLCCWEDDEVQLRHPALRGGANESSLVEAQRVALAKVSPDVDVARGRRRDPLWRPLTDSEWTRALATLSPGGRLPPLAGAYNEALYYWIGAPNAG